MKCVKNARFLHVELDSGESYNHDIVVYPDGGVEPRTAKSLSKKYADLYNHTPLSAEELRVYLEKAGRVDCIVVGTGVEGRMRVMDEARRLAERLGARVYEARTVELPELCERVKRECKRVLQVIHVTC